jgi:methionyl-tRNA formyltransferase
MARVVFMGTPGFGVPCLLALCAEHEVTGVVTQPDRPAGRGSLVTASPVKVAALAMGLPVYQPQTLRSCEALPALRSWLPDLIIVAAFGQILTPAILELPAHGCLNVHASLLPRHRGAAPISSAILAGDATTGITLMLMDEGMDTGPVLAQAELAVLPQDTTGMLTNRLADLGAHLLLESLPAWLTGTLPPTPQDNALATYCRPLGKVDGRLDWSRAAVALDRQVRACQPWPGAHTTWGGQFLRVIRARPLGPSGGPVPVPDGKVPGQVVTLSKGVAIVTGSGLLELLELQLPGKKPTPADAFVRGQRGLIGSILGA